MSQVSRRSARIDPSIVNDEDKLDNSLVGNEIVSQIAKEQKKASKRPKRQPPMSSSVLESLLTKLVEVSVKSEEDSKPFETSSTDISGAFKGPTARAPDSFDGTKPAKLRSFLAQCRLVFLNHDKRFQQNRNKVLHAGSYLTGVVADWFEPFTRDNGPEAIVLNDWALFQDRITTVFGDSDAEATAEHRLNTLRMANDEQVSTYITKFRTYAADLDWSDSPLRFAFRQGLAERILDGLARSAKPHTLSELIEKSLDIDNRYWERQREKKLSHRSAHGASTRTSSSDSRNTSSRDKTRAKGDAKRPAKDRPAQRRSQDATGVVIDIRKKSSNDNKAQNKPRKDLDRILNKEGKLTAAEKQRRADKGLCSYCGGPHKLDVCPVKPTLRSAVVEKDDDPDFQ